MPSLVKKKVKGRTYYYIAESKRVNGKPRMVKQWYLGSAKKLIALAEGRLDKVLPRQITCEQEGPFAVLVKIAKELKVKETIDDIVKKRQQGMTVGTYILIAALNRAIAASSKNKISEWSKQTAMHLYIDYQASQLGSKNFYDNFDKIDEQAVERIGDEIAKHAVETEKLPLDCLVYDTSNYFTYWDVTNPSQLARITKSKSGKNWLRHIGLALAVDRNHGLPLYHRLYPANSHDANVFKQLLASMYTQMESIVGDKKGLTLVFDKGNNSEKVIKSLDDSRHHFIGSRSPYHHKELCRRPLTDYRVVNLDDNKNILAIEATVTVYGAPRRVIATYNDDSYKRQLHRLENNIAKAKAAISSFKRKAKGADGRSTIESITRNADEILARYHVTGYLKIDVRGTKEGFKINAQTSSSAIEDAKTRFGKHILFTNRETMPIDEIIRHYRDRTIVEDAFRITKSDRWVKWDPAFHWTDSKIRVHALTCVIALLLVRIAHKRARLGGFTGSADRMMELLSEVRTAVFLYPQSTKPSRQLCSLTKEQSVLLKQLSCEIPKVR